MWLKNNKADMIWLECCALNQNGYKTRNIKGTKRSGGVIAVICKDSFQITEAEKEESDGVEYALWNVKLNTVWCNILPVYHPAYSERNQATNFRFLDELIDLMPELQSKYNKIITLGDLNLHTNDLQDTDASIFLDNIMAMRATQHIPYTQ